MKSVNPELWSREFHRESLIIFCNFFNLVIVWMLLREENYYSFHTNFILGIVSGLTLILHLSEFCGIRFIIQVLVSKCALESSKFQFWSGFTSKSQSNQLCPEHKCLMDLINELFLTKVPSKRCQISQNLQNRENVGAKKFILKSQIWNRNWKCIPNPLQPPYNFRTNSLKF